MTGRNVMRNTPDRKNKRAVSARGRNGWFMPTRVFVKKTKDSTIVGIGSQTLGKTWPVLIAGNPDAIRDLFDRIYAAIQHVELEKGEDQVIKIAVPSGIPKLTPLQIEEQIRHIRTEFGGEDG